MDTQMHEVDIAAPQPATNEGSPKQRRKSYLLSYLQKSEFFTSQNPRTFSDVTEALNSAVAVNSASSQGSSLRSSSPIGSSDGDDLSDGGHDHNSKDDEDDEDDDDYVDPDDLTNLPYKSPDVHELPGARMKYRTLVRDAPAGTAQGEVMRYVIIGKRSFRGAGLWPERLVRRREEEAERKSYILNKERSDGMDLDGEADGEVVDTSVDEDEEFDGEVEVMCSDNGEEFWLVRDPTEDASIGKQTSWVSRDWFRRKTKSTSQKTKPRDQVELRVMMEDD